VEHWQCSRCGLRCGTRLSSECPGSTSRLLKVHEWVDAFDLAAEDGVLVWVYENREALQSAHFAIRQAGWVVEHVAEVKPPVTVRRFALMGPAAWLGRPKRLLVTLRRKADQSQQPRRNRRQKPSESADAVAPELQSLPINREADVTPAAPQPIEQEEIPPEEEDPKVASADGIGPDEDGLLHYRQRKI
jgi:hypothetical protein